MTDDTLSQATLRRLLVDCRRIAVVGLSSTPTRPSYRVAAYMQQQGEVVVPVNSFRIMIVVQILSVASDDSTKISSLQNCRLKLSLLKDDFSAAASYPCNYFEVPTATDTFRTWRTTINVANFPTDTVVYMRFYANDGDHANDTEFPMNESVFYYKTYWAFYIKP